MVRVTLLCELYSGILIVKLPEYHESYKKLELPEESIALYFKFQVYLCRLMQTTEHRKIVAVFNNLKLAYDCTSQMIELCTPMLAGTFGNVMHLHRIGSPSTLVRLQTVPQFSREENHQNR